MDHPTRIPSSSPYARATARYSEAATSAAGWIGDVHHFGTALLRRWSKLDDEGMFGSSILSRFGASQVTSCRCCIRDPAKSYFLLAHAGGRRNAARVAFGFTGNFRGFIVARFTGRKCQHRAPELKCWHNRVNLLNIIRRLSQLYFWCRYVNMVKLMFCWCRYRFLGILLWYLEIYLH